MKLGDFGLAVASGRALANMDVTADHGNEANNNDTKRVETKDPKSTGVPSAAASNKKRVSISASVAVPLAAHSHSRLTECVGTPFYRSPEQEAEG